MQPRGSLTTRRMSAHWVVLAATALTTLVTAVIGTALTVFAGQALPLAVGHDLSSAPGTALSISGPVSSSQVASTAGALRTDIRQSLPGVPFGFWSGTWSGMLNLVPGALPARPASVGKGKTPLLMAAALGGIKSHAVLVAGHWPGAPGSGAADPISAALPAAAAALLHVSPGDVLRLSDAITHAGVSFRLTGLFAPRTLSGSAASYWSMGTIGARGSSTTSGTTTYGPLLVSPAAFGPALRVDSGTWLAQPDMTKFTDTDLSAISGDLSAFRQALQNSSALDTLQLSTALPAVLSATASKLSAARSLLVIVALQLLVLAVAALLATARLLATQREGETALLNARGADRWQLTRLTAAEVIPLCGLAAVIGGLAGIRLAALLATAGPLRSTGIHLPGPGLLTGSTSLAGNAAAAGGAAGTWLDAAAAALVVALVASVAMLGPVLGSGPAMTEARARRGRQAMIAGATRAGADLALVVLAVLSGYQLRRYSAASTGPDTIIDPVLALAPALALAGGTVITLRLLPAAARAGDRLAGRGRRLTASLAGWQVSRQPLRQGGAALLLVMAVATGTLALAQHASWTRSASDQASFAAGADVRVDLSDQPPLGRTGIIAGAAGVQDAMAASVTPGATAGTAVGELLAVDASRAAGTVRLRPDQAGTGEKAVFGKITPKTPPGTAIPGRPGAIMFRAAIGMAGGMNSGTVTAELGPVAVTVTVEDGSGDMYQLSAGALPADGRDHTLTAPLGGDQVHYPLRLVSVQFGYEMPLKQNAVLTLAETGLPLSGWQPSATSPDLKALQDEQNTYGPSALPSNDTWQASRDAATFSFGSGYGQEQSPAGAGSPPSSEPTSAQVLLSAPAESAVTPLPAIATSAFADANDVGPGSVVEAFVNGAQFPVTIVAVVKTFPTVPAAGAIIADLPSVQPRLVAQGAVPLAVTEWWLRTSDHQIPPGLTRALPAGTEITGAARREAALTGDPLSAAPQQALLALAGAAALLAITGFWVSIASNVRQRRAETALLAALGVSQRSAALQLCLEKLMLSVPAALLGLVLGTAVARLLVPAVTLTSAATQPVPPPLTLYDLPQTVALAAAVAVIPALAAALITIRRPDPAAELRAAEAA